MRSLFLKIFVWFWLAMALVVLAHSLSTMMVFDDTPRRMLGGQIVMFGLAASEKYEREGKAGADNYLSMLERTTRDRAYLFDESGNEVAGRGAPPKVREIAQTLAAGREDNFIQTARTDFPARKIRTEGGQTFIIVGEHQRPTGIRLPFWPGVWWAQLIAVLLTTGIFCYMLARYLTSPVVRLRSATRQLAAGDLSARVGDANGRRRDELADMGRDFDIMAERIENLMASQRRLLHDISHELRSPLARLKIALELARQSDGEETVWALDRIEREADRLNDLIGQLLTLARLESKSPVIGTGYVDLKRLVDEVVIDADFEARSHDRAVNVIASQDCLIIGNEQLLHSAIENVVRNAVSYTAEGTEVEVSLWCEDDGGHSQAKISVLDHGTGVPQAALAEIFRPFYRVADARDRQSGGIGLGLSISQRAVKIHGGDVRASNAPGGGLLVEILLPITQGEAVQIS
jgi:two-component system sensor histidine kinase CpxA